MARLYTDEDFSRPVADELRHLGHEVLTCQQAGKAGQGIADGDQLAYAISESRVILTHNRWHFVKLHQQTPNHHGIVVCTPDDNLAGLALRIHQRMLAESPLDSKLLRVNRPPAP